MDEAFESCGHPGAPTGDSGEAVPGVSVRDLESADSEAVRLLHERLSESDAYLRFCGPRPNRLGHLAELICRQDADHYALGAFDDGELVGVANLVVVDSSSGHRTAELALAVDGHEQRHGIGSALVGRLGTAALDRGVDHLTAEILAENTLMLAVVDEQGWSHALHPDGSVVHFDLHLEDRERYQRSPHPSEPAR